ncbi:XRE family transcriptional regulator [Clostridiaceae bacterium]|nr:XRE family transcriptional regulator [Clostridiaceae bacterium]
MDVGKRITELREAAGITTNRLANLCGLSQSFIRSVELGEKGITVESLRLLCDTLQISLKDFFDVPEETPVAEREQLIRMIEGLNVRQRESLMAFLKTIS